MTRESGVCIHKHTWSEIRETLLDLTPEWVAIIDVLSVGSEFSLFEVSYPYGAEILRDGECFIPNVTGELLSLNDPRTDPSINAALNYNQGTLPFGIVLDNSVEISKVVDQRLISLSGLITAGQCLGVESTLMSTICSPARLWRMTAGARSLFMLPKISDHKGHQRLQQTLDVECEPPRNLFDHWDVFKKIAAHRHAKPWRTRILFFSQAWFSRRNDPVWQEFYNHLLMSHFESSAYWRNQFVSDLFFSMVQHDKKIKPNAFVVDTAKQLLGITVGALPGFSPAIDNIAAPIDLIQRAYTDVYRLKHYKPIIMQPQFFDVRSTQTRSVYYSLSFPTAMEFFPKPRQRVSLITEMIHLHSFFTKHCVPRLLALHSEFEDSLWHACVQKTQYDFFHEDASAYSHLRPIRTLFAEDLAFKQGVANKARAYPQNARFLNGCIRVSSLKSDK